VIVSPNQVAGRNSGRDLAFLLLGS